MVPIFTKEIEDKLISGGVGVIPTDTIYGIVGRAEMPETVERIYKIRKRDLKKPCIILISSLDDLRIFGISVSYEIKEYIIENKLWPGKVSIIFQSDNSKFTHLSSSLGISFRFPDYPELLDLLQKTGPLIAPSANTEGNPPAKNINDAKSYFGDFVDFYVDGGEKDSEPSTLIKFEDNKPVVLRAGAVSI